MNTVSGPLIMISDTLGSSKKARTGCRNPSSVSVYTSGPITASPRARTLLPLPRAARAARAAGTRESADPLPNSCPADRVAAPPCCSARRRSPGWRRAPAAALVVISRRRPARAAVSPRYSAADRRAGADADALPRTGAPRDSSGLARTRRSRAAWSASRRSRPGLPGSGIARRACSRQRRRTAARAGRKKPLAVPRSGPAAAVLWRRARRPGARARAGRECASAWSLLSRKFQLDLSIEREQPVGIGAAVATDVGQQQAHLGPGFFVALGRKQPLEPDAMNVELGLHFTLERVGLSSAVGRRCFGRGEFEAGRGASKRDHRVHRVLPAERGALARDFGAPSLFGRERERRVALALRTSLAVRVGEQRRRLNLAR